MADLSATLSSAIRLHQAGVLNDAATLYAEVLASNPTNVAALSNLGVLRAAQGNLDQAAEHWRHCRTWGSYGPPAPCRTNVG